MDYVIGGIILIAVIAFIVYWKVRSVNKKESCCK